MDYLYALCIIFVLFSILVFAAQKREIVSSWLGPSNLIQLFALVVAIIFFIFPKITSEREFRHNILATNCMNFAHALTLSTANEGWQNDRYNTDFYKDNWVQILSGSTNDTKNAYGLAVIDMDRSNIIADRMDIEITIAGTAAIEKGNRDISKAAHNILIYFNIMNVGTSSCETSKI